MLCLLSQKVSAGFGDAEQSTAKIDADNCTQLAFGFAKSCDPSKKITNGGQYLD